MERTYRASARCILIIIRLYRYVISPFLTRSCRFYPTCSQYALEAIETHGAKRGVILSVRRLLKCHPFHPGGFDPVPPSSAMKSIETKRGLKKKNGVESISSNNTVYAGPDCISDLFCRSSNHTPGAETPCKCH